MFMVEDNVDDMDNWMEETMEFVDIMCINSVRMFFIIIYHVLFEEKSKWGDTS